MANYLAFFLYCQFSTEPDFRQTKSYCGADFIDDGNEFNAMCVYGWVYCAQVNESISSAANIPDDVDQIPGPANFKKWVPVGCVLLRCLIQGFTRFVAVWSNRGRIHATIFVLTAPVSCIVGHGRQHLQTNNFSNPHSDASYIDVHHARKITVELTAIATLPCSPKELIEIFGKRSKSAVLGFYPLSWQNESFLGLSDSN
ncbi:hypothetical protein ACFE04_021564 [Oxalis oulophora]